MASREKYDLETNVLEESFERCRYLFINYDDVVVSFSGGKDSLVMLETLEMVRLEMGIKKKLDVIFYDEELLSDDHVNFVLGIAKSGRFNFRWIVTQLESERFVMGNKLKYIQWDITREFVRPIPDIAEVDLSRPPMHESDVFKKYFRKDYGNLVVCLGLRASESRNRMKGVLSAVDIDKPFLSQVSVGFDEAKPIYDYTTKDIFKFFYDYKIDYAPVYDKQLWGKAEYRVATPFNNAGSKVLDKLKGYDPIFFDRITQIFPEMLVQERYYKDWDKYKVYDLYGVTPMGIVNFIEENTSGDDRKRAINAFRMCMKARARDKRDNTFGFATRYPLEWIFYSIIVGSYKQFITVIAEHAVTDSQLKHEEAYDQWKKENPDYKYE